MKKILILIFIISFQSFGQKAKKEILQLLENQTIYWNEGNIDNFMNGYLESDSLMFIGKSGVTYGYEATKNNYKKNYSNIDKMGKLKFDIKKMDFLSKKACFVLGKWQLSRPKEGDIGGHFTLIFKKINHKWVIVSDHSS